MKKSKSFFTGLICLCLGVFLITSCNDEDPTPAPLNAVGDVIIQDHKTDAGIRYGLVIYATSNYELKSVKVTGPGTTPQVYQLTATTDKHRYTFKMESGDYTAALPTKGDYTFEITSVNDQKITIKDVVGDEKLTPIAIKTAAMASQKLKTTWDKITGCDGYVVNFYSANKAEILFQSPILASDKAEYEFGATTTGWATGKSPVVNTNYVVELLGVKFETGVTADKGNNVQFITLDSKTIKWE